MPVRMRCPECEKVLNIPDAARGKAVKCPQCEARIKVPAGKSGGAPAGGPRKKPAPARQRPRSSDEDGGDIFDDLDLRQAEDRRVQLCPRCATEVREDDIECPSCGVDLETGQLSEQKKKLKARKGPDPAQFYGIVWSDCMNYALENWKLALKVGSIQALLLSCYVVCVFNQHWCMERWIADVEAIGETGGSGPESQAKFKKAAELVASLPPWDQTDAGKLTNFKLIEGRFINVYDFMMWRYEPALFWGLIGMMFSLCSTGWIWLVAKEVARVTMEKTKPLETVKLDFFSTVALGVRFTFWPVILILPFVWFPPIWLLPLICAPIALIHFNQRYNYKAYLPVDMLKVVFRIPGPTFYVLLVTFVAFLVHLGVVGALAATGVPLKFAGWTMDLTKWASANIWELQEGVFRRIVWEMPSIFLLAIAIFLPTFLTAGFPALFVMRTYGLLGKYFRPELELENQKEVGKPCGFWPRWLAYLIDAFVVAALVGVFQLLLALLLAMMVKVGLDPSGFAFALTLLQIGAQIVFPIVYFVSSESGLGQATLGKRAIGLIVVDMKGERISRSMAVSRYFGKIISALPLGAGFIMAGLDKNKQALHDKMAKTQVVWRGDDETTA